MANPVLLEIFKNELTKSLNQIQPADLEKNSLTIEEGKKFVKVFQAIKSAANINGLAAIAKMCVKTEELFTGLIKSGGEINNDTIKTLSIFKSALLPVSKLESAKIEDFVNSNPDRFSLSPVDVIKVAQASELETPPPAPVTEIKSEVKPQVKAQVKADPILTQLFKNELSKTTVILNTKIKEAEESNDIQIIKKINSCFGDIKGAAKIAKFSDLVEFCQGVEKSLKPFLDEQEMPPSSYLLELEKINTFLSGSLHLDEERFSRILIDNPEFKQFINNLSGAQSNKLEATKSPQISSEPEKSAPVVSNLDYSMVELFKVELETHTKSLELGLVDESRLKSSEDIEPLMRAAHSIKGAARIVGLQGAVKLAHAMEDVLSSAQKGKFELNADSVDILLEGNDFFKSLHTMNVKEIPHVIESNQELIHKISERLISVLFGKKPEVQAQTQKPVKPVQEISEQPKPAPKEEKKEDSLFVRVSTENLNTLMGLSGEIRIQNKFLKPFRNQLVSVKNYFREINRINEEVYNFSENYNFPQKINQKFTEIFDLLEKVDYSLLSSIQKFENYTRNMEQTTERLMGEVIASKMRPLSDGLHGLPRMTRDVSKSLGKKVKLIINGENTKVDRDILDKLEAPLSHIISNAIDHGIEMPDVREAEGKNPEGTIILEAGHRSGFLMISIRDDGKGINIDSLRKKIVERGFVTQEMAEELSSTEVLEFLFLPGFSTKQGVTDFSGRGVGLDIVLTTVHKVGGSARIDSKEGEGSTFTLQLPVTLSVTRAVLFNVNNEFYVLPLARIERVLCLKSSEILTAEDRQYFIYDDKNTGIIYASELLQLEGDDKNTELINILVVSDQFNSYGIVIDSFHGERDVVVIAMHPKLGKVPNVAAATILEDGSVALILDVDDLIRSLENLLSRNKPKRHSAVLSKRTKATKRVLVVDDSITVREVERKLLENAGYEVVVAVDGVDGFNTLQKTKFDLVISDVDMPRMNGIQFVEKIKNDNRFKSIPVMIVSYKDREEDKIRGLKAGANYYLTKSSFHDESMLNAVKDLIGSA